MTLKVLVGTYNVNKRDISQDLSSWLFQTNSSITDKPDIIVVGFQEFSPFPNAFFTNKRLERYTSLIEKAIFVNTKESYTALVKSNFVGLALFVYVRDKSVTRRILNVEIAKCGVGPLWIGNKGGVGVRIVIDANAFNEEQKYEDRANNTRELALCFVCAHFAPHSHNTYQRNQDFKSICERLVFANNMYSENTENTENTDRDSTHEQRENCEIMMTNMEEDSTPLLSSYHNKNKQQQYFTIYDSDFLFFFGDLNYRIELEKREGFNNPTLTISSLLDILRTRQHQRIRSCDQLAREIIDGRVLHGFEEGDLNFLPTYKYYVGSINEFDVRYRTPGWCDRIFYYWRKGDDEQISDLNVAGTAEQSSPILPINYMSHPSYTLSDHKPVSALFAITPQHERLVVKSGTSNSPFKIDENRDLKFAFGEASSIIVGCLWWLFGTERGVKVILIIGGIGFFGLWVARKLT
ncbi:Endonuclease/exonuclease/phosphatase [Gigaspora rosea]|uniref:Endonuclease/exonuclease/phosphatase n=1 Tax=Gigaspora rosea TaxID=44941 RepID=A0A397V5C3_9GLOM|nr:Endonuclease/exonuclease/phosphatase [Gigaspora rosea]